MPSFSKRMGLEPKKIMQIDSVDDELRTNLFSLIRTFEDECMSNRKNDLNKIYRHIWCYFYNLPYDDFYYYADNRRTIVKNYNNLEWHRVYDFIELYLRRLNIDHSFHIDGLTKNINFILERHNSGFRIAKLKTIPVTNEMEIASIVEATETGYENVDKHMSDAIEAFSEKVNTNYKMVIHHSITAVEAAAGIAAKSEGLTLNNYLNILKDNGNINSVMAEAFSKLYG